MDRFHTIHFNEEKSVQTDICGLQGDERNGEQHQGLIILWPEIWRSMLRKSKMKEKQNWASEKPNLEYAIRLRGIYFIEPEDNDFKEIIKNARKKLEVPAAPAMPCKRNNRRHGATRSKNDDHKSKKCVYPGSTGIQETAYGRKDLRKIWRGIWRKSERNLK